MGYVTKTMQRVFVELKSWKLKLKTTWSRAKY